MQNKNQQLKVHSDEPKQNENKGTQHKIPQFKVHTAIRSGFCHLDDYCSDQWVCC
jgi:hypothetical protein